MGWWVVVVSINCTAPSLQAPEPGLPFRQDHFYLRHHRCIPTSFQVPTAGRRFQHADRRWHQGTLVRTHHRRYVVAAVVGPSAVDLIWFVTTDHRIHQRGAAVVAVDPAAVDGGVVA